MNDGDRFARARALFERAMELPETKRRAYLDQACGDDADLRRELDGLIAASGNLGGFLSEPVFGWAGKRIGDCLVEGVIADGGMGVVLRAHQDNPPRDVAIKLIRPDAVSDKTLRRFELEAEVLGRLDHPGIAQIFQASTTNAGHGEQPYFVMELIDGIPLVEYADREKLSRRRRIELMVRVCDAVQHAHQNGVIHRDLKPANVLVRADGQPKVLDFGVARVTDDDLQVTTRTDVGQVIGTLPYMSPEQVGGRYEDLDTRSDVYALGVLCYELLTGRLPQKLKSKSLPEAARMISNDEPDTLASTGDAYPIDLETIVGKCLSKDKTERYASARDLAEDLQRFLDDRPISARPPSASYQFRKFARRNRGVVVSAAVTVIVLVAGLVFSLAGWNNAARERERATLEADKASLLSTFLADMLSAADPYEDGTDVRVVDVLDRAAKTVDSTFSGQPELAASAHRALGETYRGMGLDEKAEFHCLRAIGLMGEVVDIERDPRALSDLVNLGNLYLDSYRTTEADSIGAIIETLMSESDAASPEYMRACLLLGWISEQKGEFDDAASTLRPCLERARLLFGSEHTRTLDLMAALGNVSWQAGNPEEARILMEESIAIMERQSGGDHPAVIATLNNLAAVYAQVDEHDLALAALKRCLEAKRIVFGEDQFTTALAYHNLATQLRRMNRIDEALRHHETAIATCRRILDASDLRIQFLRAGYGQTLLAGKHYTDAEPVMRDAYAQLSEALGPNHPRCLSLAGSLGEMYDSLERPDDAERYRALAANQQ